MLVAFVFLSLKGKQKGIKLSVLCALAVDSIQTKTLLGVVVDCEDYRENSTLHFINNMYAITANENL